MNREIKFRAWDKKEKIMCPVKVTNWDKGCFLLGNSPTPSKWLTDRSYTEPINEGHFVEFSDLYLMQYTGLKDKNGKEIYEGDIVKRTTFNYDYDDIDNPTVKKYEVQVSFIEYRNNGFWVNMENFGWEGENLWDWDLMEVIGNIFENPELLNKEQH